MTLVFLSCTEQVPHEISQTTYRQRKQKYADHGPRPNHTCPPCFFNQICGRFRAGRFSSMASMIFSAKTRASSTSHINAGEGLVLSSRARRLTMNMEAGNQQDTLAAFIHGRTIANSLLFRQ